MRHSLPLLLIVAIFWSPSVQADRREIPQLKAERIVDKVSPDLAERFSEAADSVSKFSERNPKVLQTAGLFFAHLSTSYSRGEGMIDFDIENILAAVQFAAEKHQYQKRKDNDSTPYIIHPIGVADHLLTVGRVRDPDIIIAALLHDTVEDTETTFEEIEARFGARAASFVKEVTDDRSLAHEERKRLQILHAPHKSAGAAQIKLSDKYYNLHDLLENPPPDWGQERIDAYFDWAEQVVRALPWVNAPLLNSLDEVFSAHKTK